ncbi:two component sensor histidine kinase [Desulfocucumis palustris]|uniref:histidine kinase n=1 Tax=Desulfocucumis palustris TaxID=1898651 RepID=A0A2L2XFF4_9FIRM|nr:sensor histidine kinase [Desulfocucumis palustris]GBF32581.1 two component sensor histidine kinase [Desulfocucumis palustris]
MTSEVETLDKVIKDTIAAIEHGKRQIFEIAEHSAAEYKRLEQELQQIKKDVEEIINAVDQLQAEEKKARRRLAQVSENFHSFKEIDIKNAYMEAQQKKVRLADLRGKENLIRAKRDYLETSLLKVKNMLTRSENLASHLTAVTNYLNNAMHDVNSRFTELEQIQNLGVSIIRAQEEERRKVARDIHDGPAQLLANIIMRTEYCLKLLDKDQAGVREELVALQAMVRQSLQDVRKIIFDLRPMVLDDLGLIPALNHFLDDFFIQNGIPVDINITGEPRRFSMPMEIALFRVVQESISNIKKHSQASHVNVKMEILSHKINLIIKDNGKGFNIKEVFADKKREGYGLIGMRERIQVLNGEFSISASPGRGTTINISVPLDED